MAAFAISMVLLIAGVAVCLLVARRRPAGTPLTWGEAFVGSTFVFGLMLLAYGVVPHQWLDYADNELLWRPDKILVSISSEGIKWGDEAKTMGGTGRVQVNYQAVRDIVAATLYVVFLGGQVVLWSMWQKRGRKKPEVEVASAFGRPVMRRA